MSAIRFFSEEIVFKVPFPIRRSRWIKLIIELEEYQLGELNYIFCSDLYLSSINKRFLNHTSLTDIITFDTSDNPKEVAGDIFISVERLQENSLLLKIPFADELDRVMIHGVLHLMGYRDKSNSAKMKMRRKENACLSLRNRNRRVPRGTS